MRRLRSLLVAAGLAAAPAGAAADPAPPMRAADGASMIERFEWSMSKGRLGVMVMSLTPELRTHFGAPAEHGVLVAQVQPRSPAAAAGIAVGDVIVDVRGTPISGAGDVHAALATTGKGQKAALELVRDKRRVVVEVALNDDAPRGWLDPGWSGPAWFRELLRPFSALPRTART